MVFIYERSLAFRYILYSIFLILVMVVTVPIFIVLHFVTLAITIVFGWLCTGMLIHAYKLFTQKIIVSEEGISFYYNNKRERTLPWNIIEDCVRDSEKVKMKVGPLFIKITKEVQNYHLLYRIVGDQLSLPTKDRGIGLPKLADLEKIKNPAQIRISRDYSAYIDEKWGQGGEDKFAHLEFLGGNTIEEDQKKQPVEYFEDTGKRYDYEEYGMTRSANFEPRPYIAPSEGNDNEKNNNEELEFFGSSDELAETKPPEQVPPNFYPEKQPAASSPSIPMDPYDDDLETFGDSSTDETNGDDF